jgi:hypothetical protein
MILLRGPSTLFCFSLLLSCAQDKPAPSTDEILGNMSLAVDDLPETTFDPSGLPGGCTGFCPHPPSTGIGSREGGGMGGRLDGCVGCCQADEQARQDCHGCEVDCGFERLQCRWYDSAEKCTAIHRACVRDCHAA